MGIISEATVAKRIGESTNNEQEYVSGYSSPAKYARIKVKCNVCGMTWETSYHNLTSQYRGCSACRAKERAMRTAEAELKAALHRDIKETNAFLRELTEARKEQQRALRNAQKICPVCGELTTRPRYCSDYCQKKANNSTKEAKRREKMHSAMVDKDITVMGLFKRDAGVCYLCGGRCNTEDYVMRGENFIAGDWYPSIDHVIPLAKGGKHSWSNVKLAHRRCNSLKSDKFAEDYPPHGTNLHEKL